jgi:O-antigen/teichoic acid export membrane protein
LTSINARRIAKDTTALIIAHIVKLASSFVLTLVVARELEVTGFGVYSTVLLFFSVTVTFSALGLSNYVTRELARDLSRTNRFFVHGSAIATASSAIVTLALWIIASVLGYAPETVLGIRLIALALFPSSVSIVLESILVNHQRTEFVTLINTIEGTVRIACSLLLLLSGHGALAVISVFVVSRYVALFSGLYLAFRFVFRPHWEFQWTFAVKMLRDLGAFAMLLVLTGTFEQVEVLFLSTMHGETAVGIYSAAVKLITLWDVLPTNFMRTIFPLMSRAHLGSGQQFSSLQARSIKYLLAMAIPLSIGTMVCAEPIIRLVYGEGYDQSIIVLQILGFVILPLFVQHIPWRILLARDRQDLALRAQIISVVTRIALALLLVPAGSYVGTALTLVIAMIADNLIHLYYMQKISDRIPFAQIGWRFTLAATGMGMSLLLFRRMFHLLVAVPLGMGVYGLLILLLKGFSSDDLDLLKRIWRPMRETAKHETILG